MEYYLRVHSFTQSDDPDLPGVQVPDDAIDVSLWLHVNVEGIPPPSAGKLCGKYREIPDGPYKAFELSPVTPGNHFAFVLDHYLLDPGKSYLFKIADQFDDSICLCSAIVRTLP